MFQVFTNQGKVLGLPVDHVYFEFISQQSSFVNTLFIVAAVTVFCVLMLIGIILSHRIAGPLYRLEKHLDYMGETGERRELRFRKDDFFPEVASALNRFLSSIKD